MLLLLIAEQAHIRDNSRDRRDRSSLVYAPGLDVDIQAKRHLAVEEIVHQLLGETAFH